MPTITYTLDELEVELAARLEALDGSAFAQDGEVWAESDLPLTAVQDSTLQQHMAFSVSVESAPVVNDATIPEGYVTVLATVVLIFIYRLRVADQVPDQRASIRAARQLMGGMLRTSSMWGVASPVDVYKPGAITNEWLPIEQRYQVLLDISIPTE